MNLDELEQELKLALARKDPSPDFAARLTVRATRRRVLTMPRWMATAAAVVVLSGGVEAWRWHRGMEAKRELMDAMRLTAGKLQHIQAKVREVRP
jgi:hypothetical protein